METMIANLHRRDAGTAGESAWRAGTRSAAWKGGGAAEPLLGDLVTPPLAALRRRREPALSLSVGREPRMWARGESRGRRTILTCYLKSAVTVKEACFQQMWKNESGMLYCLDWKSKCPILTLSAPEHCQVSFHPCKFKGLSEKKCCFFFFLLLFIYMLWQLIVCLLWQKALWVGFFHSLMTHWCRFVWNLKLLNGLTNLKGFACISNTTSHVIKPAQAYSSSVCVYTTKGDLEPVSAVHLR